MTKLRVHGCVLFSLIVALYCLTACSDSTAPRQQRSVDGKPASVVEAEKSELAKQKGDTVGKPKKLVWQLTDGSGTIESSILFDGTTDDGAILARILGIGPCEAYIGASSDAVIIGKFCEVESLRQGDSIRDRKDLSCSVLLPELRS
jgi:hypothetical protein